MLREVAEPAPRAEIGDPMSFAPRPVLERPATRPLRSLLFVPGSIQERVASAPATGADAVVFDLEEPETPMSEEVSKRAHRVTGDFLRGQPAAAGRAARVLLDPRVQAPTVKLTN